MSSRKRKPVLSLAAAIHRATPSALQASASAAAAPAAAAPGTGVAAGAGKKRKRAAELISAFHVLQREQDALAAHKGSLAPAAFAAQQAALEGRLAALGGLETYQQLSIAGHSNSKYQAFNTAHWVLDVLASYPEFANLRQYGKGRRAGSGTEEQPAGKGGATDGQAVDRKLIRRQKEREKKRARKRQKKAEEEAAAAQAAKGSTRKGGKAPAVAKGKVNPSSAAASEEENDENDAVGEFDADGSDGEEAAQEDGEEEEEEDSAGNHGVPSPSASAPSAPLFSSSNRVRLLDVGSLTNHYLPYASQIDCTAIDLNPQHPSVQRKDFFQLDAAPGGKLAESFDVVVLSLVLNFVGDRFQRGEMLKRSCRMLRADGLGRLFIILPAACLRNSRWMDHDSFVHRCMRPLGMELAQWKFTSKLACYEFRKRAKTAEELAEEAAEAERKARELEQPEAEAEAEEEEEEEEPAEGVDTVAIALAKKQKAAAATAAAAALQKELKRKRKKGFQPAGIVLQGETRNNFSIAWRAD